MLREAYRAMGAGSQLVSKGRQGAEAANRVQVSPSDCDVLSTDVQWREALRLSQEHVAPASGTKDVQGAAAACPSTPYVKRSRWLAVACPSVPAAVMGRPSTLPGK